MSYYLFVLFPFFRLTSHRFSSLCCRLKIAPRMFSVTGVFCIWWQKNRKSWFMELCLCVMHAHTGGFAVAMSSVAKGHHKFQNLWQQCSYYVFLMLELNSFNLFILRTIGWGIGPYLRIGGLKHTPLEIFVKGYRVVLDITALVTHSPVSPNSLITELLFRISPVFIIIFSQVKFVVFNSKLFIRIRKSGKLKTF